MFVRKFVVDGLNPSYAGNASVGFALSAPVHFAEQPIADAASRASHDARVD